MSEQTATNEVVAEQVKGSEVAAEQEEAKEQNLVEEEVVAFKNRFETICKRREEWELTVFSTANKGLYGLLAELYKMYEEMNEGKEAGEQKRAWLVEEAERLEITFKRKKPTLIELLVKVAFVSTEKNVWRVSSYVRVLSVIANTGGVYAADIPKWIEERGGIEEIRRNSTKNSATKSERIETGKALVAESQTLASVTIDEANNYVSKNANKPVVLIGILNASGVIDIKHICVEDDDDNKISGKTAINTVLANVYSKHNKKQKKEKEQKSEEKIEEEIEINRNTLIQMVKELGLKTKLDLAA